VVAILRTAAAGIGTALAASPFASH
jgi:hypothetical protein